MLLVPGSLCDTREALSAHAVLRLRPQTSACRVNLDHDLGHFGTQYPQLEEQGVSCAGLKATSLLIPGPSRSLPSLASKLPAGIKLLESPPPSTPAGNDF